MSEDIPLFASRLKLLVSLFAGYPKFPDGMGRYLVWRRLYETEYAVLILSTKVSTDKLTAIFLLNMRSSKILLGFDEDFFEAAPSEEGLKKLLGVVKTIREILKDQRELPDLWQLKGAFEAVRLITDVDRHLDELDVRLERGIREGQDLPEFTDLALSFLESRDIQEAGLLLRRRHLGSYEPTLEVLNMRPLVT